VPFTPNNDESIHEALSLLHDTESRVAIVIASADDARTVMARAKSQGMTGKGWVYVGVGWVSEHVWLDETDPVRRAALKEAMQGVIGVRGFRGAINSFQFQVRVWSARAIVWTPSPAALGWASVTNCLLGALGQGMQLAYYKYNSTSRSGNGTSCPGLRDPIYRSAQGVPTSNNVPYGALVP
jgi:hypothetical protein